ncbi:MAG: AAA family ATPase [Gemmatimonadales bacterium]|nr:AAA family ATPase [Gemmatimonadales bacterium]
MSSDAVSPPPVVAGVPAALTRFVGRSRELDDLESLLSAHRMLTLTGAGGSGKTRLAREVVSCSRLGWERIVWIDLAPLTEPALIAPQLANGFGLVETAGQSPIDLIRRVVGNQRVLLVLDNCEHLVDAVALLVENLLSTIASLSILATSREALGVQGETAWLVPPLGDVEAALLFVERARSVSPGFAMTEATRPAVETICRRLDGIPLAIELAAARVRVITPDQIAERLSDALHLLNVGSRTALPRQRTLRGTLDWSFALLNDFERCLLERLAVFPSTFSLESAEAVVSADQVAAEAVLDGISALVDKSLIALDLNGTETRYRLLETVRQYGEERLRATGGWEAARHRHATHFLASAEAAAPHVFGGASDPTCMARLTADTPNYRALAEWAAERGDRCEYALRLGWALHWFWFARGSFEEGRKQLSGALAGADEVAVEWRARASLALAHIGIWQGWRSGITPLMAQAAEGLETTGSRFDLAYALVAWGAGFIIEGIPTEAGPRLDRAEAMLASQPPHVIHSLLHFWRGLAAQHLGDLAGARAAFIEAGNNGRVIDHKSAIAYPMAMLGSIDLAERKPHDAMQHYGDSLSIHEAIDDRWGMVRGLEGVGIAAGMLGNGPDAAVLLGAAEQLRDRYAIPHATGEVADYQAAVAHLHTSLGDATAEFWQQGHSLELRDAVRLARRVAKLSGDSETPHLAVAGATGSDPEAAPDLVIQTLGTFRAVVRGREVAPSAWGSARPRELLAFLALHPAGVSREQVGAAIWPEASAAQVRNNFHVTMHRLRKALGESDWIAVDQDRYRLDPALSVAFDANELESGVASLSSELDDGNAARLAEVLSRYHGEFLAREPAGPWRHGVAQRLQRLYVDGQLALVGRYHLRGKVEAAIEAARRIIAQDPLNEDAWRWLIRCRADQGHADQALATYRQFADLLQHELGAAPDNATSALAERISAAIQQTTTAR